MIDKTLNNFKQTLFREHLIEWFYTNKRNLPWRKTKEPYAVWVSEIMLQQTKVDTVISYYKNFMKQYPTIFHLAEAEEQDVLKHWEGLGYYSRARNLHTAVKEVVQSYNGEVPNDASLLGELKGIGPYTKGAIMSIAFNQPEPAVDGNVMRVLSRVLLIKENVMEQKSRRFIEDIVRVLICREDPSAFNQGLMELGALVCVPRSPKCQECPVQSYCRAYEKGVTEELPIRISKTKIVTKQYATVCLFDEVGNIAIEQRPEQGLLANMWQFPMFEKDQIKRQTLIQLFEQTYGIEIEINDKIGNVKHKFSHLIWHLTVYSARIIKGSKSKNELRFVTEKQLNHFPISVAHQKIRQLFE